MSNPGQGESALHVCQCEPGWSGHACDLCTTADSCVPFYNETFTPVCDKTAIVIQSKRFACESTDKQLEQLGIKNLTFALQFDKDGLSEGTGKASIQGWRAVLRCRNRRAPPAHELHARCMPPLRSVAFALDEGTVNTIEEVFYCYMIECGASGAA